MTLGQYIANSPLSLRELADLFGCSHNHLGQIANGQKTPSLDLAGRIAVATNYAVTPNDLAGIVLQKPETV